MLFAQLVIVFLAFAVRHVFQPDEPTVRVFQETHDHVVHPPLRSAVEFAPDPGAPGLARLIGRFV